jgi:shikimate dehydrogenase
MHGAAYSALGMSHTYEAIRVTTEQLPEVVRSLREGAFAGLNVTIPHKLNAAKLADEVRLGGVFATNTLARTSDGRVVAHNTDVPALTEELRLLAGPAFRWNEGRALVLGSGGAALAAIEAFKRLGAQDIAVRARSGAAIVTQPWVPSPKSEARTIAIVQATSVGMTGAAPGEAASSAVAWDALPADALALDVVYAPPETPFLRAAASRGLRNANGLGMLARQGALAFELWLGVPAPLDVMLATLRGET